MPRSQSLEDRFWKHVKEWHESFAAPDGSGGGSQTTSDIAECEVGEVVPPDLHGLLFVFMITIKKNKLVLLPAVRIG